MNIYRKRKKVQIPLPVFVHARDHCIALTRAEMFWLKCLQSHLQTSAPTPKKAYAKFQNPSKNKLIFFCYIYLFSNKLRNLMTMELLLLLHGKMYGGSGDETQFRDNQLTQSLEMIN